MDTELFVVVALLHRWVVAVMLLYLWVATVTLLVNGATVALLRRRVATVTLLVSGALVRVDGTFVVTIPRVLVTIGRPVLGPDRMIAHSTDRW